ncbi:MAG TPA: histidine kinase [Geothrix sp.]|nr:histidine kinase [Geothrix sp.]
MRWLPSHLRTLRFHLPLLALLATLPAFLVVMILAGRERAGALRHAESEARLVAGLATREHSHQVIGAQRLLMHLDPAPGENLQSLLPGLLHANPALANLGLLDRDGKLLFSVVPSANTVEMRDEPAIKGALEAPGVAIGRYRIGKIVHRPVLILARAVSRGTQTQVLFAALDLAWLENLGPQAQLPPGTSLYITDREGRVLARTGEGVEKDLTTGQPLPAWKDILDSRRGLIGATGPDGVHRLFVASAMPEVHDLFVAVGLPESAVLKEANQAFDRTLIALAVLMLLTVVSSLVAADVSVLRELRLLAAATRKLGSGDLRVRAHLPDTRGELRDLAMAFNAMAEALAERQREAQEAQAQLRALSHRVQAAREEEGARIARELHDQLGQELTSYKLSLASLRTRAQVRCPGAWADELAQWCDATGRQIEGSIESIRRIASELRPSVLDRLGLLPALEWLASDFQQRSGVACKVESRGLEGAIDPGCATALFRITQEALTNVARHAHANRVEIALLGDDARLELRIQDDGCGFSPTEPRGRHLGLLGMEERVAGFGGTFRWGPSPLGGAEILALLPRRAAEMEG